MRWLAVVIALIPSLAGAAPLTFACKLIESPPRNDVQTTFDMDQIVVDFEAGTFEERVAKTLGTSKPIQNIFAPPEFVSQIEKDEWGNYWMGGASVGAIFGMAMKLHYDVKGEKVTLRRITMSGTDVQLFLWECVP